MPLIWTLYTLDTMSPVQLYAMLRLRSEVFVVEQNCVYQDADGYDLKAHHLIGTIPNPEPTEAAEIAACARIIAPGVKYPEASLGRIVTSANVRGTGEGRHLLREAIAACETLHPNAGITLSAQQHLEAFYAEFGFATRSAPYLEDDIPHVEMSRPAAK